MNVVMWKFCPLGIPFSSSVFILIRRFLIVIILLRQVPNYPVSNRRPTNGSLLSRFLFQRLLFLSLIRLIIYLNKLYQDCNAVNAYYSEHDFYFFIISVISLVSPPVVYSFYLVGDALVKHNQINRKEVSTKTVNGLLLIPWQIKRLVIFL